MVLARSVLALHEGIREVFVLEEEAGEYVVVEEATRGGVSLLSESLHVVRKHAHLIPAVILGGAAQFTGDPSSLKLMGILYQKGGVIFTHLGEKKLLALSTSPESLYSVMEKVNGSLPGLLEWESGERAPVVKSAAEAEDIARSYLASRLRGSIFVDDISYCEADHRWMVCGSYRPSRWAYSKRFQVELDADTGSVKRFASTSPARRHAILDFFLAELACLLAILLAVFVLQHSLWR
ncbi:MAG: hypothetical protein ABSF09_03730 [Candidatus Bathyarchaeia archaeon]|jgi:hypothetical protein